MQANPPYGGRLVNLLAEDLRAEELRAASREWTNWSLVPRQLADLELLLNGACSPLQGYMGRGEYDSVLAEMKLPDGAMWPVPVVLDVTESLAAGLKPGEPLVLRDREGAMLAVLHVGDVWRADREAEAEALYGTADPAHPGVRRLHEEMNGWYVGGSLEGIEFPIHFDYRILRQTPAQLRAMFLHLGWSRVLDVQSREVMHRAEYEMTLAAARELEAALLLHPLVGERYNEADRVYFNRVRCHQHLLDAYPQGTAMLSLLPLAPRANGMRGALWRAIVARNYGCSHIMVQPGEEDTGYGDLVKDESFAGEMERLGVTWVPWRRWVYLAEEDSFAPEEEVPEGARTLALTNGELLDRLAEGREIPKWFTFSEIARQLRQTYPPRNRQGFTVFFTGLSGSGKSTLANALQVKLMQMGDRPVTLLDGDIVRTNLSSELGFSREHRNINIRRIGFVASEITKNGGIAICAPIAPYDKVRREVRAMIEPVGGFILVHVSTPLEVCEQRDRKGLYAKARAGIIKEFTGISDPYEEPADAELVLDTAELGPVEAVQRIILHLERKGYIKASGES